MPARQAPPPQPLNVSRIAVGVAVVLFFVGLFLYVSSATQVNPPSTANRQQVTDRPDTSTEPSPRAERVEGQVIVKFKQGVTDQQIEDRLRPLNASVMTKIEGIGTTVLQVPPGQEDAVLNELANDPLVQYAEPDYIYYLDAVPNDPEFKNQYGFMNTGQTVNNKPGKNDADIDAELAWDVTKGTGVKVAILDSGIDTQHPELAGKILITRKFSAAAGTQTDVRDLNGHGTHVAGIIAATANNGQGISGICPECQLMIGKITIDDADGTVPSSGIAPSIIWAADNGAQVINLSIAGPSFSQAVQDAINNAWSKNAVVVAAAGNNGLSQKFYPAAYTNVLAVANTNSNDTKSSTSNFGTWVHVSAPGDNIFSTLPTTQNFRGVTGFGYLSGTSMASPVVSGIAALVWKTSFGTNNTAVVQRIISTTDTITGTGSQFVYGRVNAAKAVNAGASPAPSAAVPSAVPSASAPSPSGIVPTFVCGGSTDSICPFPSRTNPTYPVGNPGPISGTVQPPSNNPAITGTPDPCESGSSVAHNKDKKKKHKKKQQGGVNNFVDMLLKFFIELINMILKLLGGGKIPVPVSPGEPGSPGNPCEPLPVPSGSPSTSPQPSVPAITTISPQP